MLPQELVAVVESRVGSSIVETDEVSGGCIAHALRVRCTSGDFFVKWSGGEAAETFASEATGLSALRSAASPLIIPEPLLARKPSSGRPGILMMTWIESGQKPARFWEDFGRGLAALHRHKADRYGFGSDNYIGRIPQRNTWEASWPDFFRKHRLQSQIERARSSGRWEPSWDPAIDRLLTRLRDLLPNRPEASILHGDLWAGNFLVDHRGRPVLIDPAVYFGHREADLAMAELFGGFDRRFFESYDQEWPIEAGYEERREIYNLYHLINHLNHFGGPYANSIERVLKMY